MNKLPITFALYTSTRGHFQRKTDWRLTLNHWEKQIPLNQFNLVANLKTSPDEIELGRSMAAELTQRGFHVIETVGDWHRGTSHQAAYMDSVIKCSKDSRVYQQPFYLHVEDDSLAVSPSVNLEDLLLQSCQRLTEDHELVSVRLVRPHDDRGPTATHPKPDPRFYYSLDTNLQPLLLRSLDFYRLGLVLEQNPQACQQVQCEQLWKLILAQFSRSPFKHIVYEPVYAYTAHIGVGQADYDQLVKQHNLL